MDNLDEFNNCTECGGGPEGSIAHMPDCALNTQNQVDPNVPPQSSPPLGPPKQPTRKEWKALMAKFFTVRHKVVKACGHKLNTSQDPRHAGCESCWFAFFSTNGDLTNLANECFQEGGAPMLSKFRGTKFTNNFLKYMSTLARFQKEAEAAKQETENGKEEAERNGVGGDGGVRADSGADSPDDGLRDGAQDTGDGISAGISQPDAGEVNIYYSTLNEEPVGGTEEGGTGPQ